MEDFEHLQFLRERGLGNGGFGTVLPATLHGALVAVKKLNNQNLGADMLSGLRRDVQEFHAMQVRAGPGGAGGGRKAVYLLYRRKEHPDLQFRFIVQQSPTPPS